MTTVRELTNRHRAQQLLLRKDTQDKVARLWPALDWARLDATYPELAARLNLLVRQNRLTSAGLASAYLKQARQAAGIKGTLSVLFAEPLPDEQFTRSLETTSIIALKDSSKRRVDPGLAMRNALTETQGSMARLVLNAGRSTITQTAIADPRSVGWQRVGIGKCDFCQMLLGRGAVYSEATADFEAHDHCGCTAEPVYT